MGQKRAAAPVFPFHFKDYGFFSLLEAKRPSTRRHQPPPPESARFKLQKPISKKHHHHHNNKQQQQRRRWWSSAASSALLLFKRPSPSSNPSPTAETAAPAPLYGGSSPVPLYFADDDDGSWNDATETCACWAPAMRSGHLATAEVGAASASVPYVSLRDANLGRSSAGRGGAAPAMPIYLVT